MATETDFRLDVAARLVTELQDRYRLPGETWISRSTAMRRDISTSCRTRTPCAAFRHARRRGRARAGVIHFLEETVEGYITDDAAEEDWRIARAALTLLRGRGRLPAAADREKQGASRNLSGARGLQEPRGLAGAGRRGGRRGVRQLLRFGGARRLHGAQACRQHGALVFTGEGAPQPYVVAHGYDEKSGEWGRGATTAAQPQLGTTSDSTSSRSRSSGGAGATSSRPSRRRTGGMRGDRRRGDRRHVPHARMARPRNEPRLGGHQGRARRYRRAHS